jgi:hypothetical protein
MMGHNKNIIVALLAMLFLPLILPSMASAHRSPSPLPSLEAFPVLRKVPSGPEPIISDPPLPPATNVRTYLEAFPVLRKVPSGPDPITSDPSPPPATNVGTFDLAIVRELLPVNQAH